MAAPRRTVVSWNLPTQLGLIATCHSPGTQAFSLAHRPQETGRDSGAHRVTQTWVTSLFLTTSGHRQVLTSPALTPCLATGHPMSLGAVNCSLSRRRQAVFTLHTTLICWWWPPEFGADHFEILSRVERKNIKVDN